MQLLASAKQMQGFDREAMTSYGIPGLVLMENAGRGFVDQLERAVGELTGKSILVMCGKGNNGGDGFVVARHCVNRGARVSVALLASRSEVKGDAAVNLVPIVRMSTGASRKLTFHQIRSSAALKALPPADIIIDAIFGTGFTGDARGIQAEAINWINRRGKFVASVDIPSGVDASNGIAGNAAVHATMTVTMGLAKVGQYVGAGVDMSGKVMVADISIPPQLFKPASDQVYLVETKDVREALPVRERTANKYSVGKIFVLAGSQSFTGAPFMTAQSALRAGAGAVVLGVPKSIQPVLAKKVTEVILLPLDETETGTVSLGSLDVIRDRIRWADVVVVGPGMSRNPETDRLIREVVRSAERSLVIDADGLNALSGSVSILRKRKSPTIVTPHSGELSRLIGIPSSAIDRDRAASARESARLMRCIVALKGAPTVTADPRGLSYVNSTGNPGMATIGSGDILTGIIASLAAQGADPLTATWSGVFLHGRAGDIGAERLGQRALLALDILEALPAAMRSIERA